ncbi:MAG: ferritin family protein [Deltaproteobacteria bacterium]|nr:ferritin family protein [Deltaproteobacteria bacterium]
MNFASLDEMVQFAVDKENEAVTFYESLSTLEPFSGAKDMFQEFAAEERKHAAMLMELGKNKGKIAQYKLEAIPDLKRSNYLVDTEYTPGMDYREILRIAMKREEKSVLLYESLTLAVADDTKKLFQLLAQEESKHKLALEKMYDDYMAGLGD